MSSINSVRNLRILYFSEKNKEIKKSNAHAGKTVRWYPHLYILLLPTHLVTSTLFSEALIFPSAYRR